jgi:hypothetical protein
MDRRLAFDPWPLPWRMSPPPSIDKAGAAPSGADDRRVAAQDINELRQAVDTRPATPAPAVEPERDKSAAMARIAIPRC